MSGNPNYPNLYPLKISIWISVSVFVFNVDVKWMYPDSIFSVFLYPVPNSYSTKKNVKYMTLSVSAKNKVPNEAI